ncbi:hypothetical protein [Pseudomonas germanica]|uniref:Uncharacterized protein n=1 Tax=Pseudomonas germanica TaxID=2815720 RepID=A0ABX8YRK5_9PSED|nr:hypothetical protein [Pseudomonas germanica]QYY82138.1 hypothetical protein J0G10_01395 [Pseudomonas germanica]
MSVQDEIARLTGKLVFEVSSAPLTKFLGMLKQASQQMQSVGRQAEQLQTRLNKAFGVSSKGLGSERIKLNADIRRSLDKELATETKLSKLRRQQFQTSLAEQKLVATGERQQAWLLTDKLKAQSQSAVLASKQYKAQQEALKVDLGRARVTATSEQSAIRQARLQDILRRRQADTIRLQQKAASHQSALQRAEAALQNARASGARAAERYEATKAATAVREARAAVKHDQSSQRFAFAAERHEAWKARQSEPKPFNLGGMAVGLSAVTAALYGVVRGVTYLGERIAQRQESASGAEQFNTALQSAGGKNPANQKFARDQFVDISNKYGMEVSVETAKSFAMFVQGQLALGKTLTQATKMFEDQSAVFRAASLDKQAQTRAAYQLNQIRAKGRPEGSDVNDLGDALGAPVMAAIRQAAASRLGFKGKAQEQVAWFKQAVTDAKITAADFDQGMTNFLSANGDLLARQMNSIQAAQQRVENQTYLNDNATNSDSELKLEVLDRVKALGELDQAIQPLKKSFMELDKGLTSFNTSLIRMLIGHDANGNATPNAMQKDPNALPGTVGAALGPRLKPASPNEQASLDDRARPGLLNGLRRLFTGASLADDQSAAKDNRERWAGGHINPVQRESFDVFRINSPDLGKDSENVADGKLRQFRMPEPLTAKDIMVASEQQRKQTLLPSDWLLPTDPNSGVINKPTGNVDQSMHTDIQVDVTVNALDPNGRELGNAIGDAVSEKVDEKLSQMLRTARAAQTEVE